MADYITRAKNIVANVKSKDLVIPENSFLLDLAAAFVYEFEGSWVRFIASSANTISQNSGSITTVINPSNTGDPTDIGEYDGSTRVFTPLSANNKNKLFALFFIRRIREFSSNILKHYRRKTNTIDTSDSGKDINTLIGEFETASQSESITELGDPDNDTET